jgi:hypothetical protein
LTSLVALAGVGVVGINYSICWLLYCLIICERLDLYAG